MHSYPPNLWEALSILEWNELDDNWTRYFNTPVNQQFDYNIFISITSIYVSPNDIKESKEIKKKKYVMAGNMNMIAKEM